MAGKRSENVIMAALKQLRQLALEDSRQKHPSLPEKYRSIRTYTDKTANGLTRCIIDWLRFNGHQAERIAVMGRPIDNTKVVVDTLGFSRRIGSIKWIPGSGQRGSSDISATIRGRSIKIEVKIRDRQSEHQKSYQLQIEKAGGLYWLVRSFDEFYEFYNMLTTQNN